MGKSSAKDKHPVFDWSSQPYPQIVPPPVGRWDHAPQVQLDSGQVYANAGVTVPSWIAPQLAQWWPSMLAEQLVVSRDVGCPLTETTDAATARVWVAAFYEPSAKAAAALAGGSFDKPAYWQAHHAPPAPLGDKAVASVAARHSLPPAGSSFGGIVYPSIKGRSYYHATLWLNAYPMEDLHQQALAHPEVAFDPLAMAEQLLRQALGHEWGHILGLTDDIDGAIDPNTGQQIPGRMNYKQMLSTGFSTYELAVLKWMYP